MHKKEQDPRALEQELLDSEEPTLVVADFWPAAYVNVSTKSGIDAVHVDEPTEPFDVPPFPPPVGAFAPLPGEPQTASKKPTRPEASKEGAIQVSVKPVQDIQFEADQTEDLLSDSISIVVVVPEAFRRS